MTDKKPVDGKDYLRSDKNPNYHTIQPLVIIEEEEENQENGRLIVENGKCYQIMCNRITLITFAFIALLTILLLLFVM
jgi:hypothetical protein